MNANSNSFVNVTIKGKTSVAVYGAMLPNGKVAIKDTNGNIHIFKSERISVCEHSPDQITEALAQAKKTRPTWTSEEIKQVIAENPAPVAELPVTPAEIVPPVKEKEIEVVEVVETLPATPVQTFPLSPRLVAPASPPSRDEIKEKISACYSHLVGQKMAILSRVHAWMVYVLGENPKGGLVKGEAGLGKTALMKADYKAAKIAMEMRGEDSDSVLYIQSSGEFRKNGESWKKFIGKALDAGSGPLFIYMDEFHELLPATVQSAKIIQLIKGLTDKERGSVRSVSFGDEGSVTRHESQIMFMVGTNFPSKIPDYQAISSRLGEIDLQKYTIPELAEISGLMARVAKLNIHEATLNTLARCGRGTARPIEKIIQKARELAIIADKNTFSKDDALDIMREEKLFPHGLNSHEVAMLGEGEKGYVKPSTVETALGIESKAVKSSVAYLSYIGLASVNGSQFTTSKEGRAYLAAIKSRKFTIPALKREEFAEL